MLYYAGHEKRKRDLYGYIILALRLREKGERERERKRSTFINKTIVAFNEYLGFQRDVRPSTKQSRARAYNAIPSHPLAIAPDRKYIRDVRVDRSTGFNFHAVDLT